MGRPSKYSAESRRDAVALVRDGKVAVKTAARDLGLHPETLRGWVKQDRIDRGEGTDGEVTSSEKLPSLTEQQATSYNTPPDAIPATAVAAYSGPSDAATPPRTLGYLVVARCARSPAREIEMPRARK